MTVPEVMLWQQIRGRKLGVRFRRQHPFGPYITDFFCASASLSVEVDGGAHDHGDRPRQDAERDRFLRENGVDVLRVRASDVLRDIEAVLAAIVARLARPLHQPSAGPPPRAGEEQELL
jgi:very-short-patch-repair endonuclease